MSTLRTYDLDDIVAVTQGGDESPGNLVRHVNDDRSLGTVVAHDPRPQGFSQQPQVTVLWANEPIIVNVSTHHINAKSRPLRARWSVSEEVDHIGNFNKVFAPQPRFEGEEVYGPDDLDREQLDDLRREGDVTFHSDGHVTVKRRADEPPDYLRGPDGSIRSNYFRR